MAYISKRQLEFAGEPIGDMTEPNGRGGYICHGGGKGKTKAPDYTPMANASAESARLGYELGNRQIAESQRQYEENKPFMQGIANKQLAIMDQTMQQGEDYYDFQKSTFRPLEEKIVADANNFDTEAKREELARSAVLDTEAAQANEEAQANRASASMGINPNSGRFAGMKKGMGLRSAAMRAGAATGARTQAEATGYARKMDAAGLGRNLPGASAGAYQIATGAGNSAGGNFMAPGNALSTGTSAGVGTIQRGQGLQVQGLSGIMSSQGQMAGLKAQSDAAESAGMGQAIGTIGMAVAI